MYMQVYNSVFKLHFGLKHDIMVTIIDKLCLNVCFWNQTEKWSRNGSIEVHLIL